MKIEGLEMICGFDRGSRFGLVWPLQNNQLVIFIL